MPVLSPRHSSSLSGSYRSTFSSNLSRPYYGTSTYSSPRITTFSERYTSKTYDDGANKIYSRHASITEDGITTRYREREESRRDSVNRDFNGSARSSSMSDRELSLTRDSSRATTLSMIDSVADLRSKYSPANYVPAVLRSKSINDIGRPPTTEKSLKSGTGTTATSKKVTKIHENICVAYTNHTNTNNKERLDNNDDTNGNRTSVAEMRKKFDVNYTKTTTKTTKTNDLKECVVNSNEVKMKIKTKTTHKPELLGGNICYNRQPPHILNLPDHDDVQDAEKLENNEDGNQEDCSGASSSSSQTQNDINDETFPRSLNHTTNFASYIPNKEFFEVENIEGKTEDSECNSTQQNRIILGNNDITTSPRLPRSSISQNASISTTNNRSSPNTTRASPTNNRSSPTTASTTLDTIRARSLAANDDDGRGSHFERDRGGSARSQGLNGLKNIGNTCFMNSVIQCLSNTKYLLEYVREDGYQSDINTSISSMKGALIKAFSQVIQELWSPDSSDKVVNTVALKSQIQRFAPRFMGYAQQDAQEFLRYLLEGLHEDVNRVTTKPKPILTEIDETLSDSQKANEAWSRYLRMDNSRVVDIFVGQLKSTLRCTHCGHCSVTFDPFWDLSLPIPQRQGPLRLGQCLEYFTREETMDGDEKPTCSKCKERRKCTKSFCIQKFPKILVIHLKRFSPTERFRGKLSLVIDFPLQGLDLSAFAASKSQTESMYNLYAISNHSGTTYSGHYTAYCKHPYSGQWHEYNDSRVSTISAKNIVSSEAYVLFYELINQNSHL